MKSAKSVVIASDMHVGSTTAMCSESPLITEQHTEYKPNKLQEGILDIYHQALDELQIKKPNLCVINGEPIDGANKKQLGNQSWTTNLADQAVDSIKLLKRIKSKEYLFVRGSGYHVQVDGTPIEQFIGEQMNAVKYRTLSDMKTHNADFWANVKVYGKKINFTHHIPYSKFFAYRATPLGKEMALMALDKDRHAKFDVIVRSHVHYFLQITTPNTTAFTTPAFKYPDGHLMRGGLGGVFPDMGLVELIIESNGDVIVRPHVAEIKVKPAFYEI